MNEKVFEVILIFVTSVLFFFQTICEIPDRETTGRKLQEVEEELARLKRREEKLDEKLELRKKQCHLLVHTIHQLQVRHLYSFIPVRSFGQVLLMFSS